MYLYKGFKFYKKHKTKFYVLWSCFHKNCNGSYKIQLETGNVYDFKEHTYQAMTSSEMRILLFRDDLLRDSTSSRKTKNEIICSASLFLDDSERLQLPSDKNLKWTIRNIQDEAHNFSFIKNYDIPSELMLSRSGFPFVQYDNYFDGKERLIDLWCQKNVNTALKKLYIQWMELFILIQRIFINFL
jgi:hypothetical protein